MTSGMIPPQAYTRETLAKAIEWLGSQPTSVRERATSADALIGLYMQARRRNGDGSSWSGSEAPSVEAFKADLKNLAEGLKAFETSTGASNPPPTSHVSPPQQQQAPRVDAVVSGPTTQVSPQAAAFTPPSLPKLDWSTPQGPAVVTAPKASPTAALDPRTQGYIDEVRRRMNLSSESEALRALVAIGYERIRDLLPRA